MGTHLLSKQQQQKSKIGPKTHKYQNWGQIANTRSFGHFKLHTNLMIPMLPIVQESWGSNVNTTLLIVFLIKLNTNKRCLEICCHWTNKYVDVYHL